MIRPGKNNIQHLLESGSMAEVNAALLALHRQVYRQVGRFIEKNRGGKLDVEDTFQDGLLAIYKLAKQGRLNPETNMEAYLFSICKNLWFQQLRKRKEIVPIEENGQQQASLEVPLYRLLEDEKKEKLQQLISRIGINCRKVLVAFYYKRMRMKEIAQAMEYSSEQVAKNKKADCLKKLKLLAKESIGIPPEKNQIVN